jgi:hypothetical protein
MMSASSDWKSFLRKHWGAAAVFLAGVVLAFVGSVYVFWWFAGDAQSTGLVPSGLSLWTMHHLIWFIIYLILWELLIIGVPVAIAGVLVWRWWNRLPAEERGYRFWRKRSKTSRGGGGGGFFFFVAFCVKVYIDGNWNVPIATWNLNYVVSSTILILAIGAIVIGIPATIAGVWWVRREMKKP